MALDIEPPSPPSLSSETSPSEYEDAEVVGTDDYYREELEEYLTDGAWDRAFNEWAEHTEMSEFEFSIAQDLNMFDEFDFFWDSFADRVGYHAPGLPEDWKEQNLHPDLDSWATVSSINASLTELGQTASDVLKGEYIDWESEYEAPDDLPDF